MDWRRNASNGYEAYAYIKKRPVNFEVTLDGRYLGWISNYDPQTRSSRPELYVSGKCSTSEEAMSYINGLVDKLNNPVIEIKEENKEEDTYVAKLSKDLDEYQETPTEVVEAPSDENPDPTEDLTSVKETDVVEEEKSVESPISFAVEGNTMTITSSVEGVLKYTTNGREVNTSSKIYRESFSIEGVEIVKVKLYDTEKNVLSENEYVCSTN